MASRAAFPLAIVVAALFAAMNAIAAKSGLHGETRPGPYQPAGYALEPGDAIFSSDFESPSSVPADPVAYPTNEPFAIDSGALDYAFVPDAYDPTHQTPITLFVWLHGCGGYAEFDILDVSPGGAQSWIGLAVGGREGSCWNTGTDPARVLAAIASFKTHFNIAPRSVVLGGYSSGGDLAYRTAFYNALQFAGVVVENSSPFRDTGSSMTASIAAAAWPFNVAHLAHLQDDVYPIAGVRTETDALTAAGFPMTRIELAGAHYDESTVVDLQTYLLPYLDAGWSAP